MIEIVAVGDVNLGGDFSLHAGGPEAAVEKLKTFQQLVPSADVVLANLEGPVTPSKPFRDSLNHISNPLWTPDVLAALGFNVVSLANNHIMDFGDAGLQDTLRNCSGKLQITGAGFNSAEARRPAIVTTSSGSEVRVLALADEWPDGKHMIASLSQSGYWSMLSQDVEKVVSSHVASCDAVIVYLHCGLMRLYHPKPDHRRTARRLVSLGVPLVLASHCHHIQGYETIDGSLITYGLGDFCFPRIVGKNLVLDFGPNARDSLALHARIEGGRVTDYRFTPLRCEDASGLRKLGGRAARSVLQEQSRLSKGFGSSNYGRWFCLYNSRNPASKRVQVMRRTARAAKRFFSVVVRALGNAVGG